LLFSLDIYNAPEEFTMNHLFFSDDALFINYFYNPHHPVYTASALPGWKEGVSGSIVIPTNLGISKYITEERKRASVEYLKYVSSKETQKKYIISSSMYSANMDVYKDEEVCRMIECDLIDDIYPFSFMDNDVKLFGDDSYHIKYRVNMFDFLYRNKPAAEVLKIIDDITRIYFFTLNTEDTKAGLTIFIVFLILSSSMILSLIFIFIKSLEYRFRFLSKDMWIMTTLGSVILMSSVLTLYGDTANDKCHLRLSLINIGFILSICPSLHRLITNFPEKNKISLWFANNKYIFVLAVTIFTLGLNGLFAIPSYNIKNLKTSEGLNYQKCVMKNSFGNFIYYVIQIYGFIVILISLALIFMEWSLVETSLDTKYLSTSLFMDILSLLLYNILENMQFKNYVMYSVLIAVCIMLFSVSNQTFIYFIRILPMFGSNSELEESRKILGKVSSSTVNESKKQTSVNTSVNRLSRATDYSTSMSTADSTNSKFYGITKKILSYHNQTTISNTSSN